MTRLLHFGCPNDVPKRYLLSLLLPFVISPLYSFPLILILLHSTLRMLRSSCDNIVCDRQLSCYIAKPCLSVPAGEGLTSQLRSRPKLGGSAGGNTKHLTIPILDDSEVENNSKLSHPRPSCRKHRLAALSLLLTLGLASLPFATAVTLVRRLSISRFGHPQLHCRKRSSLATQIEYPPGHRHMLLHFDATWNKLIRGLDFCKYYRIRLTKRRRKFDSEMLPLSVNIILGCTLPSNRCSSDGRCYKRSPMTFSASN
ncbi:hypothetical protein GGR54DRAFT_608757 [Hypoxylon sp. NC1633]|nr:hypothetical protein GGR54DRAFT_608757 [Hypoxylon sp. NC1633]